MKTLAKVIQTWRHGHDMIVVGVGNRLRGDDGAGSIVAERLCGRHGDSVIDADTTPENELGALLERRPAQVLFVDAVDHGGAPGECCLAPIDALVERIGATHAPSLEPLATILESHGIDCWLLGIQPRSTGLAADLSPEVRASIDAVVSALGHALTLEAAHA